VKPKPVRLTHSVWPLNELLGHVEAKADLPAGTWKRLYLVALRRLGARQPTLATLCGLEAIDLAFTVSVLRSEGGSAVQTRLEEKLLLIEHRRIGRGHVRRVNPAPEFLHIRFREVLRLLEGSPSSSRKPQPGRKKAWAAMWKSWGHQGKPLEIPDQEKPVDAAIALIARAYQYTPESLRVAFSRAKLPLGKDVW